MQNRGLGTQRGGVLITMDNRKATSLIQRCTVITVGNGKATSLIQRYADCQKHKMVGYGKSVQRYRILVYQRSNNRT